jgi:hypothetical protein
MKERSRTAWLRFKIWELRRVRGVPKGGDVFYVGKRKKTHVLLKCTNT